MAAVADAARVSGARTLWLGVWEHNPRAIAFYRKCGFEDVGTQVFVLGADHQRDLVLARPLGWARAAALRGAFMPEPRLDLLIWNLQPPPRRRNWHGGPTPLGAVRGVSADQAAWRPTPRRKSIWEMTLHIAYWKYTVRRHLQQIDQPRFPRRPSNFPAQPDPADEAAWSADVALLRREHLGLLEAVSALSDRRLDAVPPTGKRWTYGELVLGIAAHDAYHTGQVQLLKRLWEERAALRAGPA